MDNQIALLCEELKAAREIKSGLQSQLKEIENKIAQLKESIISSMNDSGLEQCSTGGYSYTVKPFYSVQKLCEPRELVRLFRNNHHSDKITEYVTTASLNSFVADELEANDRLPPWLLGSVLVTESYRLSIRRR